MCSLLSGDLIAVSSTSEVVSCCQVFMSPEQVGQTGHGRELVFIPVRRSCTALALGSLRPHEAEARKTVHKAKNMCEKSEL